MKEIEGFIYNEDGSIEVVVRERVNKRIR